MKYPLRAHRWFKKSNYIAGLQIKDEKELLDLADKLKSAGIKYFLFHEPDINQFTSLTAEPGNKTIELVSKFPLALKGIGEGINKNKRKHSSTG